MKMILNPIISSPEISKACNLSDDDPNTTETGPTLQLDPKSMGKWRVLPSNSYQEAGMALFEKEINKSRAFWGAFFPLPVPLPLLSQAPWEPRSLSVTS